MTEKFKVKITILEYHFLIFVLFCDLAVSVGRVKIYHSFDV